jgi:chloramphenicol-sensitive protein RarD
MGLLQYLTPTLQLPCGVLFLGEHMPAARWAGFGLVWVALVLLTSDTLASVRRRATAPATMVVPRRRQGDQVQTSMR